MPAEAQVELQASDLAQIVQSVFDTMLGLEAAQSETPWFRGSDRLTALVHLSGAWTGAVLLECTRGQACCFASRFLSLDKLSSVDDIVRAVLGELTNMIGGNLKSVMTFWNSAFHAVGGGRQRLQRVGLRRGDARADRV